MFINAFKTNITQIKLKEYLLHNMLNAISNFNLK